jgi:hypothetical protein
MSMVPASDAGSCSFVGPREVPLAEGKLNGATVLGAKDRWLAAFANLGVPIYGPFLPLLVWAVSGTKHPLARAHARTAFTFQCAFFAVYVPTAVFVMLDPTRILVLVVLLGGAFVLELPNVIRAVRGSNPWRLIPLMILPA